MFHVSCFNLVAELMPWVHSSLPWITYASMLRLSWSCMHTPSFLKNSSTSCVPRVFETYCRIKVKLSFITFPFIQPELVQIYNQGRDRIPVLQYTVNLTHENGPDFPSKIALIFLWVYRVVLQHRTTIPEFTDVSPRSVSLFSVLTYYTFHIMERTTSFIEDLFWISCSYIYNPFSYLHLNYVKVR